MSELVLDITREGLELSGKGYSLQARRACVGWPHDPHIAQVGFPAPIDTATARAAFKKAKKKLIVTAVEAR